MVINTKDFGFVNIDEGDIISFPDGLYGFEGEKRFALLKNPDNGVVFHLQSVENQNPRLILVDPYLFFADYNPVFPEGVTEKLFCGKNGKLNFFVVAVLPPRIKDTTVNLKSPVVINFEKKVGGQIILENKDYTVRERLFRKAAPKNRREAVV
ncbi:MAG: flagellar assembly protein FliW [Eubacteriales bacterium]